MGNGLCRTQTINARRRRGELNLVKLMERRAERNTEKLDSPGKGRNLRHIHSQKVKYVVSIYYADKKGKKKTG